MGSNTPGGGYGGAGGTVFDAPGGSSYGSALKPVDLGSGGASYEISVGRVEVRFV